MAYLFHRVLGAFPVRRIALAALVAVLFAGPAQALAPEVEAEREAREAQQALSARYTMLWAALGAGERARFAQAERHWLHHARWAEQRQCIAAAGSASEAGTADLAARCLAEVTRQRTQTLAQPSLAARSSDRPTP